MAAVVGARSSTLNPNAPVFIPAAFRQVEDFSPEWWELIKTSAWYRDYWLSEHQEESFTADYDDGDASNLLPDSFDIGFDEEFLDLDTQFREFLESESKGNIEEKNQRNGFGIGNNDNNNVAKAVLRSLSMPKSPKEKSPKPRYFERAAKCVSPRPLVRRIQQPR